MDNEKTHFNLPFSYPCWWVGERSEVFYYKERNEIITRKGKRKDSNYYFKNEINRFQKIIHISVL